MYVGVLLKIFNIQSNPVKDVGCTGCEFVRKLFVHFVLSDQNHKTTIHCFKFVRTILHNFALRKLWKMVKKAFAYGYDCLQAKLPRFVFIASCFHRKILGFSSWRKLNPQVQGHENSPCSRLAFLQWADIDGDFLHS